MLIRIVAVGKIKEDYLKRGISEYEKRLHFHQSLEIIEVMDARVPKFCSDGEKTKILEKEGERLHRAAENSDLMVALDPAGVMWSSEDLATHLSRWEIAGKSPVAFFIGGPLGLSDTVKQSADFCISLSRMTFPHQMVRLILIEQIYRADRIIRGLPYHK